jgi:hypothetical protein
MKGTADIPENGLRLGYFRSPSNVSWLSSNMIRQSFKHTLGVPNVLSEWKDDKVKKEEEP